MDSNRYPKKLDICFSRNNCPNVVHHLFVYIVGWFFHVTNFYIKKFSGENFLVLKHFTKIIKFHKNNFQLLLYTKYFHHKKITIYGIYCNCIVIYLFSMCEARDCAANKQKSHRFVFHSQVVANRYWIASELHVVLHLSHDQPTACGKTTNRE